MLASFEGNWLITGAGVVNLVVVAIVVLTVVVVAADGAEDPPIGPNVKPPFEDVDEIGWLLVVLGGCGWVEIDEKTNGAGGGIVDVGEFVPVRDAKTNEIQTHFVLVVVKFHLSTIHKLQHVFGDLLT